MRGPKGASSQPPCASRLRDPAPMFVRKSGIFWVDYLSSLVNRTLRPPGHVLPYVGWYRAYLEIRSP